MAELAQHLDAQAVALARERSLWEASPVLVEVPERLGGTGRAPSRPQERGLDLQRVHLRGGLARRG